MPKIVVHNKGERKENIHEWQIRLLNNYAIFRQIAHPYILEQRRVTIWGTEKERTLFTNVPKTNYTLQEFITFKSADIPAFDRTEFSVLPPTVSKGYSNSLKNVKAFLEIAPSSKEIEDKWQKGLYILAHARDIDLGTNIDLMKAYETQIKAIFPTTVIRKMSQIRIEILQLNIELGDTEQWKQRKGIPSDILKKQIEIITQALEKWVIEMPDRLSLEIAKVIMAINIAFTHYLNIEGYLKKTGLLPNSGLVPNSTAEETKNSDFENFFNNHQ